MAHGTVLEVIVEEEDEIIPVTFYTLVYIL